MSPKILDWMEEWTGKFSIIQFYLSICARTDIHAYPAADLRLLDIGKPEALEEAERFIAENPLQS